MRSVPVADTDRDGDVVLSKCAFIVSGVEWIIEVRVCDHCLKAFINPCVRSVAILRAWRDYGEQMIKDESKRRKVPTLTSIPSINNLLNRSLPTLILFGEVSCHRRSPLLRSKNGKVPFSPIATATGSTYVSGRRSIIFCGRRDSKVSSAQ